MDTATHGSVELIGGCLRCGDCCRLMCKEKFMVGEDGVCRYLNQDNLCDIHLMGKGHRKRLPPEVLEYWTRNCEKFPWYLERQHPSHLRGYLNLVKWPTKNCGYSVVIGTDGE